MITKWLKLSTLKVNEAKMETCLFHTETCLFHQNDQPTVTIKVQGNSIRSSQTINILGVLFNSKISWGPHMAHAIAKANRAFYAIKIIRNTFHLIK